MKYQLIGSCSGDNPARYRLSNATPDFNGGESNKWHEALKDRRASSTSVLNPQTLEMAESVRLAKYSVAPSTSRFIPQHPAAPHTPHTAGTFLVDNNWLVWGGVPQ